MRSLLVTCYLLFGSVLGVTMCCAQQSLWLFQLKAGPQFVRLSDPLASNNGPYTGRPVEGVGYLLGGGVERVLGRVFGWRTEMLCSVRNTGYDFDESSVRYKGYDTGDALERGRRSTRTTSIEMPLLLTVRRWSGLRLDLGPALAYMVQARQRTAGDRTANGEEQVFDEEHACTSQLQRLEWAVVTGAEVESGGGVSMGIRYWAGLTNLDKAMSTSPSYTAMWKLTVGLLLGNRTSQAGPSVAHP